ncbi:MAG: hypothetical protein STHCBS139747_001050 [Sporothrix thermara]
MQRRNHNEALLPTYVTFLDKGMHPGVWPLFAVPILLNIQGEDYPTPDDLFAAWHASPRTLHRVVVVGMYQAADMLIHDGADIEVRDFRGETPLHTAIRTKRMTVALSLA